MSPESAEVAASTPSEHPAEHPSDQPVRVALVGDLHTRVDRPGRVSRHLRGVDAEADILLLAGDLTDHGAPEEAAMAAEELADLRIPKVAVLGNHDHESGKAGEVSRALGHGGIHVLDGDVFIFEKRLGIAGVKGFCGGFDEATLEPWGEEVLKRFALEAVTEALKLESALARVRGLKRRIALLHYSPVRSTIVGENLEIAPFLGCSRLVEPIDKFGATFAAHGHAHRGQVTGKTPRGITVYNTAMELLRERLGRYYLVVEA